MKLREWATSLEGDSTMLAAHKALQILSDNIPFDVLFDDGYKNVENELPINWHVNNFITTVFQAPALCPTATPLPEFIATVLFQNFSAIC